MFNDVKFLRCGSYAQNPIKLLKHYFFKEISSLSSFAVRMQIINHHIKSILRILQIALTVSMYRINMYKLMYLLYVEVINSFIITMSSVVDFNPRIFCLLCVKKWYFLFTQGRIVVTEVTCT